MEHKYKVSGITCTGCEAKIKSALLKLNDVLAVEVSGIDQTVTIHMDQHIALSELQKALGDKYRLSVTDHNETLEQTKSWLATYKPVLLIFVYITVVTLLIQSVNVRFDLMQWMRHFMAGFFLVFSFFKMLSLKGFAESYVMYDIVARRFPLWSYIYVFLELGLGIANLLCFHPRLTQLLTAVIMSISLVGVLQTVWNKKKIRCACLGTVFNLPMSTITIIEDALMIVMSLAMLQML